MRTRRVAELTGMLPGSWERHAHSQLWNRRPGRLGAEFIEAANSLDTSHKWILFILLHTLLFRHSLLSHSSFFTFV